MTESMRRTLARRANDYDSAVARFEASTGLGWHQPTPGGHGLRRPTSVVIPARDVAYCLPAVLDALAAQQDRGTFEVILVDDASRDGTLAIAQKHLVVDRLIRTGERLGAAACRNIGTAVASGETILYLDADMVLPPNVVADFAARADEALVLVGFRHNVVALPDAEPCLEHDHRVRWHPPVGRPLMYTGLVLQESLDGRPLDHTRDFRDLGFGRRYYDWDLPRMVVTALVGVPRHAVIQVGGFDPDFGRIGWGTEDTHLGAKLIAAGLCVVPLRQAVGFHLDPPDAEEQWKSKLATWPRTHRHYQSLLDRPAPDKQSAAFSAMANELLSRCEVLR